MIDNKQENILYYTQNNIGSTSMLTNNKGEKVQLYLFTPYGEPWITEDPVVDVERKFTGHIYDKESKLYYMNARYMDPETGIFISPDPAMDGLNHYAYCSANPIKYTDPTGLMGEGGGGPPSWCSYTTAVGGAYNDTSKGHGMAGAENCRAMSMVSNGVAYDGNMDNLTINPYTGWAMNQVSNKITQQIKIPGKFSFDDFEFLPYDKSDFGLNFGFMTESDIVNNITMNLLTSSTVGYSGVKITRGVYDGIEITSKWVSEDGKTLYYGNKVVDKNGKITFTSKTETFFRDKLEVYKNGKVIATAQVQSTPDLLAHPNGLSPYTVPEGKYENKGLWGFNNKDIARLFPFAVLIHGKIGTSGRPNSLGCTVTYNNNDLPTINNAIKQIINKDNQFNVWIQ